MYSLFDINQAIRYLSDTVVMYKKAPTHIVTVTDGGDGDFLLQGYKLGDKKKLIIPFSDKDLDLKPVKLGFAPVDRINNGLMSFYICRMPARRWKIGLSGENTEVIDVSTKYQVRRDWHWEWLRYNPLLTKCILGEYPSFNEGRQLLSDYKKLVTAISRDWAMDKTSLYYKTMGVEVGVVTENKCKLHEPYEYLQESLNEVLK